MKLFKTMGDGVKIYLVEDKPSGHHWSHANIPEDEIWINELEPDKKRAEIREVYERSLCVIGFDIVRAEIMTGAKERELGYRNTRKKIRKEGLVTGMYPKVYFKDRSKDFIIKK